MGKKQSIPLTELELKQIKLEVGDFDSRISCIRKELKSTIKLKELNPHAVLPEYPAIVGSQRPPHVPFGKWMSIVSRYRAYLKALREKTKLKFRQLELELKL